MTTTHRLTIGCLAVSALVAAMAGCTQQPAPPPLPATPPAGRIWLVDETDPKLNADVEARLQGTLPRLNLRDVGLNNAIDFLRELSGVNILVKWWMLEGADIEKTTPVTVALSNVTVGNALQTVLDEVGGVDPLDFVVDGGVIVISTKDDLSRRSVTRIYDISNLLDRYDLTASERSLLRQMLGEAIKAAQPRADQAGKATLADLYRGRADELAEVVSQAYRHRLAIQIIQVLHHLVFPGTGPESRPLIDVHGDKLIIVRGLGEHRQIRQVLVELAGPEADRGDSERRCPTALAEKALDEPIGKLELDGISFSDAMTYWSGLACISLRIKHHTLYSAGVREETPVDLTLAGVTARRALRAILEDVSGVNELDFMVDEGKIIISTREDLARIVTARFYDVGDLLGRGKLTTTDKSLLRLLLGRAIRTNLWIEEDAVADPSTARTDPDQQPIARAAAVADGLSLSLSGLTGQDANLMHKQLHQEAIDRLAEIVQEVFAGRQARHLELLVWLALEPWSAYEPTPPWTSNLAVSVHGDKLMVLAPYRGHKKVQGLLAALRGQSLALPRTAPPVPADRKRKKAARWGGVIPAPAPPERKLRREFEIPPNVDSSRWPAGQTKALAKPVDILGVKTSRVYVVFLLDCSGSMLDGLDLTKLQATRGIESLSDQQHFDVIFHSVDTAADAFGGKTAPADKANVQKAKESFNKVFARGRTDAIGALKAACKALAASNGSESQIIFYFTDGEFHDDQVVLAMVKRMAEQMKVIICPVIVGEFEARQVNVLKKIADITGGKCIELPTEQ